MKYLEKKKLEFESYIKKIYCDCWIWTHVIDKDNVPYFNLYSCRINAKRASCIIYKNAEYDFFEYLSECGNQLCVNPNHIKFYDTIVDKFRDLVLVKNPSECWEWIGYIEENGYGIFNKNRAHRFSYQLFYGDLNPDLVIMHKCDNRKCVNPNHLEQGTIADNVRDMFMKGRGPNYQMMKRFYGENHPNCKYTDEQIQCIRGLFLRGLKPREISNITNISYSYVKALKYKPYLRAKIFLNKIKEDLRQ